MWDQVSKEWSLVGGGALQGVVLAIAVRGSRLFVGGRFAAVGGVEAANVALFDGNAWSALGPGKPPNHEFRVWSFWVWAGGSGARQAPKSRV